MQDTFAQKIVFNQKDDSVNLYCRKYLTADSFPLKIYYLKKAITFSPADSLYLFLSGEYFNLSGCIQARKYAYKAITTDIRSIYSYQALDQYLQCLSILGCQRKVFQILKNYDGDSVFFKDHFIQRYNVQNEIQVLHNHLNDLSDSIHFWERINNRSENNYSLTAQNYFKLGLRIKANGQLNKGLKKFPKSGILYFYKGKLSLLSGKYYRSLHYFRRSKQLGLKSIDPFINACEFLVDHH